MTAVALAIVIGAAMGLLAFATREGLRGRFDRDVGWLEHAVWRFTPGRFDARPCVAAWYAANLALLAACLLGPLRLPLLLLMAVLLAAPRAVFAVAWSRRRKAIEQQLPGAVRQMSSGVASGLTLVQAIERLAERAATPIRCEFRVMTNLWKLGSDLSATIEEARRRLDLPGFNLFASAVIVNQRMGGNAAQTLDQLAGALEEIDRMRKRIHAETAEGRMSVKVLAVTPLVFLFFVTLFDRQAVGMLFTTGIGQAFLAVSVLLTAFALSWAWRIVHADI